MKIQILNYSDLEKVNTEVVLLRGHIVDSEAEAIDSSVLRIKLVGERSGQTRYIRLGSVRVIHDSFSALLTLFQGSNSISFHFKSQLVEEFHLIYQDASSATSSPNSSDYKVKPLIVTFDCSPNGSTFSNDSLIRFFFTKIDIGLKLVQWYFSEKLVEAGFPRSSFSLTDCSTFNLPLTPPEIGSMTSSEVWEVLARGIRANPELWSDRYKYVAFSLHRWKQVTSEDAKVNSIFALEPKSAVAGGGLVLLDHKLLFSWPEKLDELFTALEDPREVPDHTSLTLLMSTLGRQFGATLGVVAHELGHVFDLGHEERGLMGKDFHRFALTFQPKIKSTLGLKTERIYLTSGNVCEDPVQVSASFLTLLHYNRWFQDSECSHMRGSESDSRIWLEKNLILSTTTISMIEVRNPDSAIVISSWTGNKNQGQGRTTFRLSKGFVPIGWTERRLELVVQNASGTILKVDVNFSQFPQGTTPIIRRMMNSH